MQKKMIQFLKSIGINDISSFDIDFDNVGFDCFKNLVLFDIKKESPWDYFVLSEFLMALSNVHYKFEINFTYGFEDNAELTKKLFKEFYLDGYFVDFPFEITLDDNITIHLPNEEEAKKAELYVNQFNEIISFIGYKSKALFVIDEISENEDTGALNNNSEEDVVIPNSVDEASSEIETEANEEEQEEIEESKELSGEELIEQARKEVLKEGEDLLIKEAENNYNRMLEERNRQRVWKMGDYTPLNSINEIYNLDLMNIDIDGFVFDVNERISKNGKKISTFGLGNYSGAISCRAFESKRISEDLLNKIIAGKHLRIRGAIELDKFKNTREIIVHFIDILPDLITRVDDVPTKRVELHLHTKMSALDGCADIEDYVNYAAKIGMKALALTDHGVIQSFPNGQKAVEKLHKAGNDFKLIYGCEFYAFSSKNDVVIQGISEKKIKDSSFVVFDTETTGLSPNYDRIIEFGAVLFTNGMIVDRFESLVNVDFDLSQAQEALSINKITEGQLRQARPIEEVLENFLKFIGDRPLVAHNASFDISMVNAELNRLGKPKLTNTVIDTLALSRYLFPESSKHNEGALLRNLGLITYKKEEAHRALYDAELLSQGFFTILDRLLKQDSEFKISDLNNLVIKEPEPLSEEEKLDPEKVENHEKAFKTYVDYCKHFKETHLIALAKNQKGLEALHKLVSDAHITYLGKYPRIPFEEVEKYRDNLLLGSACFNGNVFDAAMTREKGDLLDVISFYDYIEIQPLENYSFLLNMKRLPSQERLIQILKDIIEVAKKANKPIVATGDVHYLNPEDKILRDIIIEQNAIGGGLHPLNPSYRKNFPEFANPDQHFRTTREMLTSFESWLSKEDAFEYVVTNSNLIADMVDSNVIPVQHHTFPPVANLPNADEKIRDLVYRNFANRYEGNTNPEVIARVTEIKNRLDEELRGIIDNGYAVTYFIAQQLIKKANDEPEHYIVGSRGSVGSSFAATMADITEVNPLAPHYLCPRCHYLEWGEKKYKSGYDMPDKKCPECGHKMKADGQNIPFATFLGFKADKVPDIDLNFEDESQKKAFNYTKELLGASYVFRAGTIQTVKTKTAYGYVAKYFENRGQVIDNNKKSYVAFLANKLEGIKRTTGQHAGGVIVVPSDHDVFEFTAVQYPADEASSKWLTTHYDFHSIHDEILKFDILGHLDPMAMRYYRDLTKLKIEDIPMNDQKVISLFSSTKELHLKKNILGWKNGAAALPEFGTNLGLSLLEEAQPKSFNDLLIIEGLSHGTNVWKGNAQDLIRSGKTLAEVIGCRDDIMTYLISCGIDNLVAFKIMEDVRHGKRLKEEYESLMRANHVPEYYIDSCNKIAYLFPRGHAVAYATMAVRVAYFKLYYPLEFYAVYFSIRSDDWNINTLIQGEDVVLKEYNELKERSSSRTDPLSVKEENILATDQIALEMFDRGYKFSNIDLYKSDAKMFVVDYENKSLIPPFVIIPGLGEAAAISIVEARNDGKGEFISEKDLLKRATKLNNTSVQKLKELGCLEGLSETNQLSLF